MLCNHGTRGTLALLVAGQLVSSRRAAKRVQGRWERWNGRKPELWAVWGFSCAGTRCLRSLTSTVLLCKPAQRLVRSPKVPPARDPSLCFVVAVMPKISRHRNCEPSPSTRSWPSAIGRLPCCALLTCSLHSPVWPPARPTTTAWILREVGWGWG